MPETLALHVFLLICLNRLEMMNPSYVFLNFCHRTVSYQPYSLETAIKLDEVMAMVVASIFYKNVARDTNVSCMVFFE